MRLVNTTTCEFTALSGKFEEGQYEPGAGGGAEEPPEVTQLEAAARSPAAAARARHHPSDHFVSLYIAVFTNILLSCSENELTASRPAHRAAAANPAIGRRC
ncbi:hypothetical protein EVAR_19073_1 [Eumeta japonica]|uniref:Uncharacterized protein n=1 Tax=Eumeta variegata TaxID=151549 RepID=A0A4C1UP68_EUMVA|nr:hypothetical protein EVAR_19073_1 [Eumeta japonica]